MIANNPSCAGSPAPLRLVATNTAPVRGTRKRPADPRLYQIAFLAVLLGSGVLLRDFALQPAQVPLAFGAGLAAQTWWLHRLKIPHAGYLSAVITCFGLCILLRADNLWVHPLAASLAISSKFILRVAGKHVWNPGNFGVVLAITLLPGAWASPGQWGNDLAYAGWFAVLGFLVTSKTRRLDMSGLFLGAYLSLLGVRVLLLGQNWAVLLHQMQSGALLLFAFFMISDPMTIPNHPRARVAYAVLVAALTMAWQFGLYRPNALLWALFLASPLVPLFDHLCRGERFNWQRPHSGRPG
jgi:Na+-transporting NADH:ubiquinone oxidoreductase subunit NqrB